MMDLISSFQEYYNMKLPTHKEVCSRCMGGGSVDLWEGGMTSSEMDEMGEDFLDDYLSGHYSKICPECDGQSVVDVVSEEYLSEETLRDWDEWWQNEYDYQAEIAAERRMGC